MDENKMPATEETINAQTATEPVNAETVPVEETTGTVPEAIKTKAKTEETAVSSPKRTNSLRPKRKSSHGSRKS